MFLKTYRTVRRSSALLLAFVLSYSIRASAQQPLSDDEKKRLFLKAREEMTTIPWTPPVNTEGPAPKPKPKNKPPTEREDTPPKPANQPPKPQDPAEPRVPKIATPPPIVRTPPTPRPQPITELPPQEAPFRVEKPSLGKVDDDDEPPKEESRGFLSRLFGSGSSYKYVTGSVKRAISNAPVRKGRWRYIVVHNSGTRQGSAKAFEHYHRYVRGMSTRKGEAVWLEAVLDEARDRAARYREERAAANARGLPDVPAAELAGVSEAVGQAALLYFDVSSRRMTDVTFDWDIGTTKLPGLPLPVGITHLVGTPRKL